MYHGILCIPSGFRAPPGEHHPPNINEFHSPLPSFRSTVHQFNPKIDLMKVPLFYTRARPTETRQYLYSRFTMDFFPHVSSSRYFIYRRILIVYGCNFASEQKIKKEITRKVWVGTENHQLVWKLIRFNYVQ